MRNGLLISPSFQFQQVKYIFLRSSPAMMGFIVTWTIGTSPNAELVNTMLDNAIEQLSEDEHTIIHSDRGCHYRWPGLD